MLYASKVRAQDDSGRDVPVMHACGHDLHMAALLGTAAVMAHSKDTWHGTLMLIGQPAEETISGAKKMIGDGFLTRFPKPDVGVAMHVGNEFPAGKVAVVSGYTHASADSLRITIFRKGGAWRFPQNTIDLSRDRRRDCSLVAVHSREVKPGDAAVVPVDTSRRGQKITSFPRN